MTNADATKQPAHAKKRTWRDGAESGAACGRARPPSAGGSGGVAAAASALLAKYRAYSSHAHNTTATVVPPAPSMVDMLPPEMVALVLAYLDGQSLLHCSTTCRTMAKLSYARDVWKNICMTTWPSLSTQVLPQLPGAPDYDLIRLYGGSWRRCFVDRHRRNQRVEMHVEIPQFAKATASTEKVVSDTFSIGEHRFCLWIFPHGNPNELQYVGRVLSVYLVLTDLDRRPPNWLTCAVFSLSVINHNAPCNSIEWHSCLVDNKFDGALNNWGVHSLGLLKTLRDPASGFLLNDALTVTASVRLMSITFRLVFEKDLQRHRRLGLADFADADSIELPFCCSLQDLLTKLHETYGVDPATVRVWCFNQPVVSGQALRPRKRLTQLPSVNKAQQLFGNLLCDGVDIDAYSFCLLYIDCPESDEPVLNDTAVMTEQQHDSVASSMAMSDVDMTDDDDSTSSAASTSSSEASTLSVVSSTDTNASVDHADVDSSPPWSYLFVKVLDPETLEFLYLGRFPFHASDNLFSTSALYECVARKLFCSSYELVMFKEEIAPTLYSGPIAWSQQDSTATSCSEFVSSLQPADIVIFTHTSTVASGVFDKAVRGMLQDQYTVAECMLQQECSSPSLEMIESFAERLDIPKFRVRSAFRKCQEDGRNTLRYIMEGRHLGFICDSCGETDFRGPRFNCSVCSDYDLCRRCHVKSHDVCHRYANVDGRWQRVYEFKDHKTDHATREMLPVFYDYCSSRSSGSSSRSNSALDQGASSSLSHDSVRASPAW